MSAKLVPVTALKLGEAGRVRVPLSLTIDQVRRLDAAARSLDVERATVARMLLLKALTEWERQG